MTQWFRSGIFRRILLSLLAVSLAPLLIVGGLALRSGDEAGADSIDLSRKALDAKSTEMLELRAVETANTIARFLQDRESDLRSLALLPRTAEAYQSFSQTHRADLWAVVDGKEQHRSALLYQEVAYVNAHGQEAIKIVDGSIVPSSDLVDVSHPANTLYRSETYFAETRRLSPGEVYVSHVTGSYVSRAGVEEGGSFRGIIRFAMPVSDDDGRPAGIVVMALDSRHLAEFTGHIVPTEERFAAAPDPKTGNYAYIIDDEAYVVAHPDASLIRGLDEDSQALPYAARQEEIGVLPVRLDRLGFMDENLAGIPDLAAQGKAGSIQYAWEGHDKFVAYAPIAYYGGPYAPPAGFGWVGIGANVNTFHLAATSVGEAIQAKVRSLAVAMLTILAITGGVVLVIAGVLAQQISDPIRRITAAARSVERNEFHLDMLGPLLEKASDGEIVHLARVFTEMAFHVERREQLRRLLDVVIGIGVALPEERNFNRLLETVVMEAKTLCNADAGTLYLLTEEDTLEFVILRNDTLNIAIGGTTGKEIPYAPIPLHDDTGAENHANVAAHTVHSGTVVSIPDVYQEKGFDFSSTKTHDAQTGYRSKSFLSVPLQDSSTETVGVLQLMNALDPQTGEVIAFEQGMNRVIEALASLGTVALKAYMREAQLRRKIEELRIKIDETRKQQQVEEITETEYFRQLQQRARELRERKGGS